MDGGGGGERRQQRLKGQKGERIGRSFYSNEIARRSIDPIDSGHPPVRWRMGGKRMESRLKATMKADDDNSPGPVSLPRLLLSGKMQVVVAVVVSSLPLFLLLPRVKSRKRSMALMVWARRLKSQWAWGGLIFTKHFFPPVFPTPRRTPSHSAGSLRVLKMNRKKKKGTTLFFFTLERKTKKSLLHPTTKSRLQIV